MQLAQPDVKNVATLARRLQLTADGSAVTLCDTTMPPAIGATRQNGATLALPTMTLPDVLAEFDVNRCVADAALCNVLCAPFYTKSCSCNNEGVVSALCVERDSSFVTASCVGAVELGRRCQVPRRVVCAHAHVYMCVYVCMCVCAVSYTHLTLPTSDLV